MAAVTAPAAAAALSLLAAWVHLAYAASHLRQWWAYGAFFVATGAGQALFAPLILRVPAPRLAAVGIAGNVAIVGMYVVSRTAGARAASSRTCYSPAASCSGPCGWAASSPDPRGNRPLGGVPDAERSRASSGGHSRPPDGMQD